MNKKAQTITFNCNDTFLLLSYSFHFLHSASIQNIQNEQWNFRNTITIQKLSTASTFDICVCRFLSSYPISVLCFYSSVFHSDLHPFYSPFELLCFRFDVGNFYAPTLFRCHSTNNSNNGITYMHLIESVGN